ncbi:hypothetical protein CRENBAI_001467 [Crenichthys baileyi]|uniref:Uncharacterized protein n=1 Tax=Crenichthys baileyi TaxID=28760 RepID=A0AAV9R5T0_9TELE
MLLDSTSLYFYYFAILNKSFPTEHLMHHTTCSSEKRKEKLPSCVRLKNELAYHYSTASIIKPQSRSHCVYRAIIRLCKCGCVWQLVNNTGFTGLYQIEVGM